VENSRALPAPPAEAALLPVAVPPAAPNKGMKDLKPIHDSFFLEVT